MDGQTDVLAHELRVKWLLSVRIRWPQSHCALFRQQNKSLRHHVSLKKWVFSDCHLKVGSCRFEGTMILLIHFLNCQKALFAKKKASSSNKYRVKSIR